MSETKRPKVWKSPLHPPRVEVRGVRCIAMALDSQSQDLGLFFEPADADAFADALIEAGCGDRRAVSHKLRDELEQTKEWANELEYGLRIFFRDAEHNLSGAITQLRKLAAKAEAER